MRKSLFMIGWIFLWQCAVVSANDCRQIKFIKAKSPGAIMIKDQCSNDNMLTLGSEIELSAGARLWLTSAYTETSDQQLICQNRTNDFVHLKVTQLNHPWMHIENLAACDNWQNNRLNCQLDNGQRFFCVMGVVKHRLLMANAIKQQERTTSVSMRAIAIDEPKNIMKAEQYADLAVENMQPEIDLCRRLFNSIEPVELIWNVKLTGEVEDVSILSEGEEALSTCIRDVVANYAYPKPNETVTFVYEF